MDLKPLAGKFSGLISKYKYAIGILLLGLVLMLVPGIDRTSVPQTLETVPAEQTLSAEEQLSRILSRVSGAGEVQVLLSCASGEKTVYQTNTNTSGDSQRTDTVTVTDAERNQTGLISQVDPPVYLGAVILCQGADDPSVRLAIVDAVSKYTGLSVNQISVLKMK